MMKKIISLGVLCLSISFSTLGYSQIAREKQATKSFNRKAYFDAIKIYERMVEKGYINTLILSNLADSYYFNSRFVEANQWYTLLFEVEYEKKNLTELPSEYYYRYAQTLKSVGDYKKSQRLMEEFIEKEQEDSRTALYLANPYFLAYIENHSNRYDIQAFDFNSMHSDYGGTIVDQQFVFTSTRITKRKSRRKRNAWTNEGDSKLYAARINQLGFEEPVLFAPELSSKVNDATAVFTQDGQTMYFTRNNSNARGKSKQNRKEVSVLKIYRVVKEKDGRWGHVEELPINSDNFNTAHPALTPDDKWLYFSSDRKGTLGQSDLFRVPLYENGTLGKVENLGKTINTAGKETFPFISSDYHLYFSSDGHPGLGGLDVYAAKIYADGSLGPVLNMGEPINSNRDDFGFYLNPVLGKGFVSSNRIGGKGSDDIYFIAHKPCRQRVRGKIYDKDTQEALVDALIVVSDLNFQKMDTLHINADGYYRSNLLNCTHKYRFKVEKSGYNTVEITSTIKNEAGLQTLDIGLEKAIKELQVDDNLADRLKLEPIYFDFDEASIRKDAAIELMKIVELMKEYPTIKIDIRSHTDSRGEDEYNFRLSDQRVKETMKWMVVQGIDPVRLTGRGYGETNLLNHCSKGVSCTETEHQVNRRCDFIIQEI